MENRSNCGSYRQKTIVGKVGTVCGVEKAEKRCLLVMGNQRFCLTSARLCSI